MNIRVERTPAARRDIVQIAGRYSDEVSSEFGERFLVFLEQSLALLSEMPLIGREWEIRTARTHGLRVWHVKHFPRYLIFYRFHGDFIEIVRILYARRNLPRILG